MEITEQCNVTNIKIAKRLPFAATVVRLPAPIAVKIRGKELRVVQVARQKFKTLIA